MPLVHLPSSTIKLIGSSQVITSVSSVVKELMENALDAGATSITIKLEKHGLEKIEIKDDGCGVSHSDMPFMCLPNYTSKISKFIDLNNLNTYGFRGEALSSLCTVANVSVTTKTSKDDIAMCYSLNNNGQIRTAKVAQLSKGTVVVVMDLFKCLPVRKQLMSSSHRANEELRKVEHVVKLLAIIHPRLRVALIHNKFMIWQKMNVSNLRQSIGQVISHSLVKHLHYISDKSDLLKMELLVPKRDCDIATVCTSTASESSFLFINLRPVCDKKIEKVILNKILQYFGHYIPTNKYPVFLSSITVNQELLDVNLEPNKTRVFLKNQEEVLNRIDEELSLYYQRSQEIQASESIENNINMSSKKQKLDLSSTADLSSSKKAIENNQVNVTESFNNRNEDDSKNISNISQHKSFIDPEIMSNKFENQNCVSNILYSRNSIISSKSDSTENVPNEKNGEFSKNEMELDHGKGMHCSTSGNANYTGINKLEKHMCVEKSTHDSTCNQEILTQDQNNVIKHVHNNNINLGSNILLEISDSKSTEKVICGTEELVETFTNPIITESQECRILGIPTNRELTEGSINNHCFSDKVLQNNKVVNFKHKISTSQWSKGEMNDCNPIQLNESDNENKFCSNENRPSLSSCFTLDHSVATQMGKEEMTAFTKFARNMRSKILEETPGITFIKVAGELANKWRNLDTEERDRYEKEAAKIKKEKKQKKQINVVKPEVKQSTLYSLNKNISKRPAIEMLLNVDNLKKLYNTSNNSRNIPTDDNFELLYQVEASPLWIFYNGYNLKIVSSHRLQEAVNFHQHLSQLKIPLKPSEEPLFITSQNIEPSLWKLLISLEFQNNIITDLRITHNGFSVELIQDSDVKAVVTHVPLNIKYYGIEDFCEILNLINVHGYNCSLLDCRPLKVKNYIRNEVFRECYPKEAVSDPTAMKKLLLYWVQNVEPYSDVCLHGHPVAMTIQ